jgi:UDP-GlcNAc:undecaprenyl-phosphate/decaprenyl-phosphate GlcNAc-1-phosphate transferase
VSITVTEYILLGVAAFAFSGLLTWPVRAVAIKLGAMDLPNLERKTQIEPVPYLGGVSIALTITVISFASVLYSDNTNTTFPLISYVLLPAALLGIMGLIDDLRGLPPLPRLFFQSAVGVVVAVFLSANNMVGTPLDNSTLNQVINIIWIVGICNSINFFDNLDGGAAGTVAISTLGIAAIAVMQKQELVSALAVVTAGATIGFLLWNKSPAKIYMGDAGALFLGVIVSVLTIRLNPGIQPKWNSLALLPILLAVPILDTCIAVFSRIWRGISPLTGGKDHLSHRLMRKGFTKRGTALCLWGVQASFVALALIVYKWTASLGTPVIVLAGAYWLGAFVWFWRIPSSD